MSHLGLGLPYELYPRHDRRGKFNYTRHLFDGGMVVEVQLKNRAYWLKRSFAWGPEEDGPTTAWEALKEHTGR